MKFESDPNYRDAQNFINNFRKKGKLSYEGSVGFTLKLGGMNPIDFVKAILGDVKALGRKRDNHNKGMFVKKFYYDRVLRYIRFKYQSWYFRKK